MSNVMPEGEAIRRAIKWISSKLEEKPQQPILKLVDEATLRFDLSPKDAEFLMRFYREAKSRSEAEA